MKCFHDEKQKDKNTIKDNSQSECLTLINSIVIKVPLFCF